MENTLAPVPDSGLAPETPLGLTPHDADKIHVPDCSAAIKLDGDGNCASTTPEQHDNGSLPVYRVATMQDIEAYKAVCAALDSGPNTLFTTVCRKARIESFCDTVGDTIQKGVVEMLSNGNVCAHSPLLDRQWTFMIKKYREYLALDDLKTVASLLADTPLLSGGDLISALLSFVDEKYAVALAASMTQNFMAYSCWISNLAHYTTPIADHTAVQAVVYRKGTGFCADDATARALFQSMLRKTPIPMNVGVGSALIHTLAAPIEHADSVE
ncbi:MAG: hypothetical protein EBZ60_08490 [Betaproteobacteria bacterium]|nr:hypothetical protein [Betaproteobacteria bacterium]